MKRMKKKLTEQNILKSRAKDYMNKHQLDFFSTQLKQLREETLEDLQDARAELHASAASEMDEFDQAMREEENRMRLRILERKNKLLPKIEEALIRIGEGNFGYCEITGKPIGLERLLARPTATLCAEEKERQEKLERNFRHL